MRHGGNERRADGTNGMIHLVDEKRLRIRHVAGHMKGEVLPPSIGEQMIARYHSGHDEGRDAGVVALPDQILIWFKLPARGIQGVDFRQVFPDEARVLPELADQDFMCLRQGALTEIADVYQMIRSYALISAIINE